ncbi:hypothetical protein Q5P01_009536 [Channa striata]|uniref:Uncharacterized protein n=1 Tax=Channa striata TaxID=64152 RepID=A0AA88SXJ3_CHASR|nr:hypothetical protein Q5P01_009536 [Channa striata]
MLGYSRCTTQTSHRYSFLLCSWPALHRSGWDTLTCERTTLSPGTGGATVAPLQQPRFKEDQPVTVPPSSSDGSPGSLVGTSNQADWQIPNDVGVNTANENPVSSAYHLSLHAFGNGFTRTDGGV